MAGLNSRPFDSRNAEGSFRIQAAFPQAAYHGLPGSPMIGRDARGEQAVFPLAQAVIRLKGGPAAGRTGAVAKARWWRVLLAGERKAAVPSTEKSLSRTGAVMKGLVGPDKKGRPWASPKR